MVFSICDNLLTIKIRQNWCFMDEILAVEYHPVVSKSVKSVSNGELLRSNGEIFPSVFGCGNDAIYNNQL